MGIDHTAHGKARHPWLTGTASWFYVAATKHILGIQTTYKGLVIDPCIPSDWKNFEVTRKWRDAIYNIKINNTSGAQKGIKSINLNGKPVSNPIPIQGTGSINNIVVEMG